MRNPPTCYLPAGCPESSGLYGLVQAPKQRLLILKSLCTTKQSSACLYHRLSCQLKGKALQILLANAPSPAACRSLSHHTLFYLRKKSGRAGGFVGAGEPWVPHGLHKNSNTYADLDAKHYTIPFFSYTHSHLMTFLPRKSCTLCRKPEQVLFAESFAQAKLSLLDSALNKYSLVVSAFPCFCCASGQNKARYLGSPEEQKRCSPRLSLPSRKTGGSPPL